MLASNHTKGSAQATDALQISKKVPVLNEDTHEVPNSALSVAGYWVLVVSCAEPTGPVPKPLCPAERLICKFTSIAVEGHTFETNSGARWI